MNYKIPNQLQKVFNAFDKCKICKTAKNSLQHVLGGGKFSQPRFMFVFINPTHLNISSHKKYKGERRFPFMGVRHFYKFLAEAGFLDKKIIEPLYKRGWKIEDEKKIEESLRKNNVYLTNLVKCSQPHPFPPKKNVIQEQLPLLKQEIKTVAPRYIVTFGKIPFETLTEERVLMRNLLKRVRNKTYSPYKSIDILGKKYAILPNFFPLGHGNTPKAIEILKYIKKHYSY
jgi:uracil-DNA glycosylase family 4